MKKTVHSDQKYITALVENDEQLIAKIYKCFADKIIGFVQKNNGSIEDAKDLIQDALMDYLTNRDTKKIFN